MATDESNLVKRIREGPINYALLKLIHHELGNGLAVLSGYRHLLQRAISAQTQEASPPRWEVWQHRNEQWSGYLQAMHDREALLNDFLAQLRELSPGTTYERLCQDFVRTDLGSLLGRVIERLAPLHPDQTLQVHMPAQPLFVLCDPLWMELVLEHILSHTIATQTASIPIDISLAPSTDDSRMAQEANIAIRINSVPPGSTPGRAETFDGWSPVLDQSTQEVCLSMCREVLQEHGGRIWSERRGEQEEIVSLALPLVD